MTDDSHDRPVLNRADRALLAAELAPTDAQLEATRRALGTRIAALAAGAAAVQVASTAHATGAAGTAASAGAAATATQSVAAVGAIKWIGAGLIATAIASGAVVATRSAERTERPRVAQSPAAPQHAAVAQPSIAPVAPSAAAVAVPEAPAVRPIEPAETPAPMHAPAARSSVSKGASQRAGLAKPSRAREGETLSAELALLHDARQALARHDTSAALRALDDHAARFPNAVLRQEALSARALALCEAGRSADARRVAAQLERLAPRSPHLIRLADSCAFEGSGSSSE